MLHRTQHGRRVYRDLYGPMGQEHQGKSPSCPMPLSVLLTEATLIQCRQNTWTVLPTQPYAARV